MTSTSFAWVLLDGQGPDAATLDHDSFDVQRGDEGTAGDTSQYAAAARGAQSIATASGHKVGSVQVTWTEDVEADAAALLKSLADLGFDNVHAISLSKAAQAWGIEVGRQEEYTKTGLCILEPDAATIMIVATGAGTVRTAVTDTRETAEDLVAWLRTVFRRDGWLPDSLYLVGALPDLDEVTQPIADALSIPVSDSVDTQLALARGAALTTVSQVNTGSKQVPETSPERPWHVSVAKKPAAPEAAETVVAPTVSQVDTESTTVVETPRNDPPPRVNRPWVVGHAKKLTISAAAVAVFGAGLSLAAGSALNVENTSAQAADPAASRPSVPSASVRTVPAPVSERQTPPAQPLAAQPPPPPPPPEPLAVAPEPAAAAAPEPAAVPVPQHTVSAPQPTAAVAVPAAPVAVPVSAPAAPPQAAPVVAPAAPPPVAHLAAPPVAGPGPAAPPAAPVGAPPAPIAPPPAAAPVPPDPAAPPPPPDPVQVVLSPLFSGLP